MTIAHRRRSVIDPSPANIVRRRVWRVRWDDLPQAAKNKLASTGELVIKAGGYSGAYDYTWNQVKAYFTHAILGNETADLA